MPDTIKIYRYLPAEWALRTLQERRLKVARLKELNDPFEWRVGSTAAEPGHQITLKDAFERSFDRLNDMIGILCFSSEISDPVIWSHYSAGHQGIALEFDHFITPALHEVSYDDKRPVFDVDHHVKSDSDSSYPRSLFGQFLHKKRHQVGTMNASIESPSILDPTA